MEFHCKLKEIRGNIGQEKLAEMIGVSKGLIGQYETNRKIPTPAVFLKLCHALEVNPAELAEYLPPDCETARLYRQQLPIAGRVAAGPPYQPEDDERIGWVHVGPGFSRDRHIALEVRGDSMSAPPAAILNRDTVVIELNATPAPGEVVVARIAGDRGYTLKLFTRERSKRYLSPSSDNPAHGRRELQRGDQIVGVMRMLIRKR